MNATKIQNQIIKEALRAHFGLPHPKRKSLSKQKLKARLKVVSEIIQHNWDLDKSTVNQVVNDMKAEHEAELEVIRIVAHFRSLPSEEKKKQLFSLVRALEELVNESSSKPVVNWSNN